MHTRYGRPILIAMNVFSGLSKSFFISRLSCQQLLLYALTGQPPIFWNDPPRHNGKDGYGAHDDGRVVKGIACDREHIRRVKYGDDPAVPQDGNCLERFAPTTEAPCWLGERLWCEEEPAKANKPVSCG